jgi:hypothetical protein
MLLLEPMIFKKSMTDQTVMRCNNIKDDCRVFDAPV